ncbi:hypothetical protein H9P43_000718 [Blastocladiella emersonii ATCC 22665]|nr:hypothetical protein H9P43_000718 [Blastocladiella emersonii ATCC 22665]
MPDAQFTATPAERPDYEAWFVGNGGNLAGDSIGVDGARAFFLQSQQPNDVLSAVWRLANRTNAPAALRFSDFCIAANLLMQIARRQLPAPPAALSQAFVDAADAFAAGTPPPAPTPFDPFPSTPAPPAPAPTGPAPSSAAARSMSISGVSATGMGSSFLDGYGSGPSGPGSAGGYTAPASPLRAIEPQRTGASIGGGSLAGLSAIPTHRTGGAPISPAPYGRPGSASAGGPPPMPRTALDGPLGAARVSSPSPLGRPSGSASPPSATIPRSLGGSSGADAPWAVPADKQATYGGYFVSVDAAGKGYATGAECFDMFSKSGLPAPELSKIWNLVTSDGQLRKEDFIVAMHLIFEKLAGKPIPDTMPADLIPPSRRPASAAAAPPAAPRALDLLNAGASVANNNASTASISSLSGSGPAPAAKNQTFEDIIGGGSGASATVPRGGASSFGMGGSLSALSASPSPAPAIAGLGGLGSGPSLSSTGPGAGTGLAPPSSSGLTGLGGLSGGPSSSGFATRGTTPGASGLGSMGSLSNLPTSGMFGSGGIGGANLATETRELNELVQKTESLTMQRIETTNALNHISVEKQNLMIRLGQAKVTFEAEEKLLEEMKEALDMETAAYESYKEEVLGLERQRVELQGEKRELQEGMIKHRHEADQLRNRIVSLNLEINSMRQELAKLREEAARERDNYEFNRQSVQNIEDTKDLIKKQLDAEQQAKLERDASRLIPPPPAPVPAAPMSPVTATSPQSPARAASPAPSGPASIKSPTSRAATMDMAFASPSSPPTSARPTSVGSAVGAFGSGNDPFAALASSPPMIPVQRTGGSIGNALGSADSIGRASNSKSPGAISARSFNMSMFPSPSQLPTVPTSPPPPMPAFASPLAGPTAAPAPAPAPEPVSAPTTVDEIPDEYKKEFDNDFSFDFQMVSPVQNTATATAVAAPVAANSDPFAAMMAAAPVPAPFMTSPTAAPTPAPAAPAPLADDFDPFSFPAMPAASATSPKPAPAPMTFSGVGGGDDPFLQLMGGGSPATTAAAATPAHPAAGPAAAAAITSATASAGSLNGGGTRSPTGARSPSPTSGGDPVVTVMAMGFSKEQAVQALERYDFDAEKAINYLFDSGVMPSS